MNLTDDQSVNDDPCVNEHTSDQTTNEVPYEKVFKMEYMYDPIALEVPRGRGLKKEYMCDQIVNKISCGNVFRKEYMFHRHGLDVHGVIPPPKYRTYVCNEPGCDVMKMTREGVEDHRMKCHGLVSFCIKGCGATFTNAASARHHGSKCQGEGLKRKKKDKTRQCITCGKVFAMGRILKQHIEDGICGQEGSVSKVPCTICNKLFAYKRNMIMHVKRCHPECYQGKPRNRKPKHDIDPLDFIKCEVDIKCELEESDELEIKEEDDIKKEINYDIVESKYEADNGSVFVADLQNNFIKTIKNEPDSDYDNNKVKIEPNEN